MTALANLTPYFLCWFPQIYRPVLYINQNSMHLLLTIYHVCSKSWRQLHLFTYCNCSNSFSWIATISILGHSHLKLSCRDHSLKVFVYSVHILSCPLSVLVSYCLSFCPDLDVIINLKLFPLQISNVIPKFFLSYLSHVFTLHHTKFTWIMLRTSWSFGTFLLKLSSCHICLFPVYSLFLSSFFFFC